MRKLKKFVLNNTKILSREELASIEGSLNIDALDNCSTSDAGKSCVYAVYYDGTHSTIVLGVCQNKYSFENNQPIVSSYCA